LYLKLNYTYMRYLLAFMFLVAIFVFGRNSCNFWNFGFFSGIRGEGLLKTEIRDVSGFRGFHSVVSGDIEFSISDTWSVEVTAQENILPVLKTTMEGDILNISFDQPVSYSEALKIKISAPSFDAVKLYGSGTIRAMTPVHSNKMDILLAGSGEIFIPQAEFDRTVCSITGSGGIELSGQTRELEADISGSGEIRAAALNVQHVDIGITGSGNADVHAVQTLKVVITGSGDVGYSGNPAVESSITGSGDLTKKEIR
jgi:Putative auto-transporter adhesin, head GIN domain